VIVAGDHAKEHWRWLVCLPWTAGMLAWLPLTFPRRFTAMVAVAAVLSSAAGLALQDPRTLRASLTLAVISGGFADWTQRLIDFDRDGNSPIYGGDCDDFDAAVGRHMVEIVGNGIDDNCIGGDLTRPPHLGVPVLPRTVRLRRRQSVIVISVDTLRKDHVGRVIQGRPLTPNIDKILRESVVFTNAYSHSSYTTAALTSLWTSSPLLSMVQGNRWLGFEASLVELLAIARYRTVAIAALPPLPWHLVLGFMTVETNLADYPHRPPHRRSYSKDTTDRALVHAARLQRARPFLLWVHYVDPHAPYQAHAEGAFLGNNLRGRYAQEVLYTDKQIGRLVRGLEALGLWDESLVIFFADHGELLGQGGFDHAWSLHQDVVGVPLALRSPRYTPRSVATPVSLLDLAPTVMEILGGETPPLWIGRSLAPALRGQTLRTVPLFFQADFRGRWGPSFAVIDWPWKYREDAPAGLPVLEYLGEGEPPGDPDSQVPRLRRLLGKHVDRSLNNHWLRRKAQTLRLPRPGCAWALRVGLNPEANRSLAVGFEAGPLSGCGPRRQGP
jgi:arylsulfatase A-like enzyme